jgi:hypothetical protein
MFRSGAGPGLVALSLGLVDEPIPGRSMGWVDPSHPQTSPASAGAPAGGEPVVAAAVAGESPTATVTEPTFDGSTFARTTWNGWKIPPVRPPASLVLRGSAIPLPHTMTRDADPAAAADPLLDACKATRIAPPLRHLSGSSGAAFDALLAACRETKIAPPMVRPATPPGHDPVPPPADPTPPAASPEPPAREPTARVIELPAPREVADAPMPEAGEPPAPEAAIVGEPSPTPGPSTTAGEPMDAPVALPALAEPAAAEAALQAVAPARVDAEAPGGLPVDALSAACREADIPPPVPAISAALPTGADDGSADPFSATQIPPPVPAPPSLAP